MRGREGERRTAPARGEWPERDQRHAPSRTANRRSRSPIKSKLMAMAMSNPAGGGRDAGRSDRRDDHRGKAGGDKSRTSRERPRKSTSRDRDDVKRRRMRMDEMDDKQKGRVDRVLRSPGPPRKSDTGAVGKSKLDNVVKKAREAKTNYWDKKIIEAEEKDPKRWGHSGFKELYQRDLKRGKESPVRRRHSRSSSFGKGKRSRSPIRRHSARSVSRSRSGSPVRRIAKSRKDIRNFSRSPSPSRNSRKDISANRLRTSDSKTKSSRIGSKPTSGHSGGKSSMDSGKRISAVRRKPEMHTRSSSNSSSGSSLSRSRSRSPKRSGTGSGRLAKAKDNKRAASETFSSSSNSSDDNDVLQLHARNRGHSSSISNSSRSRSSSSLSRSPSVGAVRRSGKSSSSSSSSVSGSSSDDSDSDVSIRAKPQQNSTPAVAKPTSVTKTGTATKTKALLQTPNKTKTGTTTSSVATPKKVSPAATKSTGTAANKLKQKTASPASKETTTKPATTTTATPKKSISTTSAKTATKAGKSNTPAAEGASKTKPKTPEAKVEKPAKKPVKSKSPSESGETESETDSSDSDSEPRMTLSERFAKLAQMSTDKREMAKPVLSVNEIDTKMRVVKDLRNPETKVYAGGNGTQSTTPSEKIKPRTRSPPQVATEIGRRGISEERRRHFERMSRDAPTERPLDWSDPRVRFNYYKDRGCFDERPINFDEYIKWEEWYHQYREWLETEGYYGEGGPSPSHQQRGAPRGGRPPPQSWAFGGGGGGPGPSRGPRPNMDFAGGGRRPDNYPGGPPPLSSRTHFGRPEGNAYLEGSFGRRIDRTPGGSLVVNIRGNHANGFNNGNGYSDIRRRVGLPNRPR